MKLTSLQTKKQTIISLLEKEIYSGTLPPKSKLASMRELSKQFVASLAVVQSAVKELENNGLVKRMHGNGVYVRSFEENNSEPEERVLLCMETYGHMFEDIYSKIRTNLIRSGLTPITFEQHHMNHSEHGKAAQKVTVRLLNSNLKCLILAGLHYWQNPFLENYPELRSVFLNVIDYAGKIPERAVLFDLESGFYQAIAHLAATGRKRIMLYMNKPDPCSLPPQDHSLHWSAQIISGYERALEEYGIFSGHNIFYYPHENMVSKQGVINILNSKNAPDAIVCTMDATAVQLISELQKCGVKIPDDLAIVGHYNTPWVELSPIKLTSVNYDSTQLATAAVELALKDKPANPLRFIKPKLKIRESS